LAYYKNLLNACWKALPIYEGKDIKTKMVVYSPEEAFNQFQKYISNLLVEIYGNSGLFFKSVHSMQLIGILRGMLQEIKINSDEEHKKIKPLIFKCTNLCEKMIKELEG
jgi:hypothetical protein